MIAATKKSCISVTRDDIPLSDRDIVKRYIGIDSLPCKCQSPLREDDESPSFSMQERGGVVFWKDFGTGESGSAVSLLAKLWHVTYTEALLKIRLDTENPFPKAGLIRKYRGKIHLTGGSEISVRTRPWKSWDVEYWKSYGISRRFAEWCCVHPVSHAFFTREVDGRRRTVTVPLDKYAYAYFEWKDGKESIKLYQPYSTTMKWLSKHDASVWDLWRQAFAFAETKSDRAVIITSSRKDAMCLWYNLGIPAMSMQGEGYLPKPQVMSQILGRFREVYLWYDNDFSHAADNPGQDNAMKLVGLYPRLRNICIPSELGCKDPSDLVRKYGKKKLRELWTLKRHACCSR